MQLYLLASQSILVVREFLIAFFCFFLHCEFFGHWSKVYSVFIVTVVVLISGETLKIVNWGELFNKLLSLERCFGFWNLLFHLLSLFAVMQGLCGITKLVGQKDMVLFLSVIIR